MIIIETIQTPEGLLEVPSVQLPINPVQTFKVVGWRLSTETLTVTDPVGGVVDWLRMGRLSDQPPLVYQFVVDQLEPVGWDFTQYPDPVVLVGTYIGDTPPTAEDGSPLPSLLASILSDLQQSAMRRAVERDAEPTGDPGPMTEMGELLGEQADQPINIIHSPESESVTAEHQARFENAMRQILPILREAGFEQFLLTVHQPTADPDGLGLFTGAIDGAVDPADVGGLLLHANRICNQYLRYLKKG